jgi:hypothetical protein
MGHWVVTSVTRGGELFKSGQGKYSASVGNAESAALVRPRASQQNAVRMASPDAIGCKSFGFEV